MTWFYFTQRIKTMYWLQMHRPITKSGCWKPWETSHQFQPWPNWLKYSAFMHSNAWFFTINSSFCTQTLSLKTKTNNSSCFMFFSSPQPTSHVITWALLCTEIYEVGANTKNGDFSLIRSQGKNWWPKIWKRWWIIYAKYCGMFSQHLYFGVSCDLWAKRMNHKSKARA